MSFLVSLGNAFRKAKLALGILVGVLILAALLFGLFPLFQSYLATRAYDEPMQKDAVTYEDAQEFLATGSVRQIFIPYLWLMDKLLPNAFLHISDIGEYVDLQDVFSYTTDAGGMFKVLSVESDNTRITSEIVSQKQLAGTRFTSTLVCLPSYTSVVDGRKTASTLASLTSEQRASLEKLGGPSLFSAPVSLNGSAIQTIKNFLAAPETQDNAWSVYVYGRCLDSSCSQLQNAGNGCVISFLKTADVNAWLGTNK